MKKILIFAMICLLLLSGCAESSLMKEVKVPINESTTKCFIVKDNRIKFSGYINSYEFDEENNMVTVIFTNGDIITTNKENVFIYEVK